MYSASDQCPQFPFYTQSYAGHFYQQIIQISQLTRLKNNEHAAQVMCMKTQQHDGILSQGREGALSLWKEGQCVRTSSVASTGFCRFALSDDQRHCFVGLDEKSKVGIIIYNV